MHGFKAVLESDVFAYSVPEITNFNMTIVNKNTELILHSHTFQHYSHDTAIEIFQDFKDRMMKPTVLFGLMASELSERKGLKIDFNKGLDGFIVELIGQSDTDILKRMVKDPRVIKDNDFRMMIENELKKRGEIQNDKLDYVGSSKQ